MGKNVIVGRKKTVPKKHGQDASLTQRNNGGANIAIALPLRMVRRKINFMRRNGLGLELMLYDTNWNGVSAKKAGRVKGPHVPPPRCLQEMIQAAERLASDLPFVRVDLYEIAGEPYFGELTFYPLSGMKAFEPREFDFEFGRQLDLSPWVRPAPDIRFRQ